MKTQVFITIDTEFSIGGAFQEPDALEPIGAQNVLCDVAGRSEGLGFMLDTFARHGQRATFFVETLQTAYFGDAPMAGLAQRVAAQGHDVQLHLHPVWTYFDHPQWRQQLSVVRPNDRMHGQELSRLASLIGRGQNALQRWGLPAPVALRTGNLMVDRNVYRAMATCGLTVASNIACAVFEPAEAALRLASGVHLIEGVTELPVLTYSDLTLAGRVHQKALTVTGSSLAEAVTLLDQAHACAEPAVVLLTHCHEFVKGDMRGALRPDRVNQRRLAGLCEHLARHADRFEVSTFRQVTCADPARWRVPAVKPMLRVPPHLAVLRLAQNKLNELNWL